MTDLAETAEGTLSSSTGDLRAVLHYRVEGKLWVRREQLGTEWQVEREGKPVTLALPTSDGTFRKASSWPSQGFSSWMGDEGPAQLFAVDLVQVTVALDRGLGDEGSGNAEMVLLREADEVATSVVRSLLDWARTGGHQFWLPPGHERPSPEQDAWLETAEGARVYSTGFRRPQGIVLHGVEEAAQIGDFANMTAAVLAGETEAPVAESLLAHAGYAVWATRDPDTQRAVLSAAIALETKTPETLRAVARGDQRDLLELLLTNYDEVPTSVKFQLSKVAERVCGRSLRQSDGALFRRVSTLYKLRNEVAHRGATPEPGEAREAVQAARDAFAWLDGLAPCDAADRR